MAPKVAAAGRRNHIRTHAVERTREGKEIARENVVNAATTLTLQEASEPGRGKKFPAACDGNQSRNERAKHKKVKRKDETCTRQ